MSTIDSTGTTRHEMTPSTRSTVTKGRNPATTANACNQHTDEPPRTSSSASLRSAGSSDSADIHRLRWANNLNWFAADNGVYPCPANASPTRPATPASGPDTSTTDTLLVIAPPRFVEAEQRSTNPHYADHHQPITNNCTANTNPVGITRQSASCRKHHRRCHQGGWTVSGNANETLTFTAPDGVHYLSKPPP